MRPLELLEPVLGRLLLSHCIGYGCLVVTFVVFSSFLCFFAVVLLEKMKN